MPLREGWLSTTCRNAINIKKNISPGQTRDKILISTRNRERTVLNSYYLINVELHFKCEVGSDFKRQEN